MRLIQFSSSKCLFCRLIQQLEVYAQRSRTRKQLLEMDDYALKDIGLTRQQALKEGQRHFWQGDAPLMLDVCAGRSVSDSENSIRLRQGI